MSDETRTRRPVLVYVTDRERAALQARADADGRSLSSMARLLLCEKLGLR